MHLPHLPPFIWMGLYQRIQDGERSGDKGIGRTIRNFVEKSRFVCGRGFQRMLWRKVAELGIGRAVYWPRADFASFYNNIGLFRLIRGTIKYKRNEWLLDGLLVFLSGYFGLFWELVLWVVFWCWIVSLSMIYMKVAFVGVLIFLGFEFLWEF